MLLCWKCLILEFDIGSVIYVVDRSQFQLSRLLVTLFQPCVLFRSSTTDLLYVEFQSARALMKLGLPDASVRLQPPSRCGLCVVEALFLKSCYFGRTAGFRGTRA